MRSSSTSTASLDNHLLCATIHPSLQPHQPVCCLIPNTIQSTEALPPSTGRRVGCHLATTWCQINSEKLNIRWSPILSTNTEASARQVPPHTHPAEARPLFPDQGPLNVVREDGYHGVPWNSLCWFRRFCTNNGWMTDQTPRNPTEQPKREPPSTTTASSVSDTNSSIASSSSIAAMPVNLLTCNVDHLLIVDKRL